MYGRLHFKSTNSIYTDCSHPPHSKIGFIADEKIVTKDNCGLMLFDSFAESRNKLDLLEGLCLHLWPP